MGDQGRLIGIAASYGSVGIHYQLRLEALGKLLVVGKGSRSLEQSPGTRKQRERRRRPRWMATDKPGICRTRTSSTRAPVVAPSVKLTSVCVVAKDWGRKGGGLRNSSQPFRYGYANVDHGSARW